MIFIWNKKVRNITAKTKNDKANSDETPGNFKHAWPAGTCLIVGDSILTGIDEKRLSRNNQVVKVRNFRSETSSCPFAQKETWTHNTAYWNEWCCFKNVQTDSWRVTSTEAIHYKYVTNLQSDCFQTNDSDW